MTNKVFIIAEAGVNHNGSLDRAKELVDVAAESGADAVKFQTFRAVDLATAAAPKADYQVRQTGGDDTQLKMLQALELDERAHAELVAQCQKRGIQFLSTPFDPVSLDMLVSRFDLPILKIPSGEITNAQLLLKVAATGRRVIVSTGMCDLTDIETALGILAFGFLKSSETPGSEAFARAFKSETGKGALKKLVTLLHCTTEYPAPFEEVNLRAMTTLRDVFSLPVGYSDHTPGITIPIAAVAQGAVVIEKHFTVDKTLPGPDHKASLDARELRLMVQGIRETELALGDGKKVPTASESRNRVSVRKSLVAAADIAAGEKFTEANLAAKRPGGGVAATAYWDYIGKTAPRAYRKDELIQS